MVARIHLGGVKQPTTSDPVSSVHSAANASRCGSTVPGKTSGPPRLLRALSCLSCLLLALLASGCMHRRMTIRSDPPGALVLVDGEEIGTTPVGFDYTYYGTRNITLIKDGYQTKTVPLKLGTPWYQVVPLDFISDNFAGRKINDWREATYALEPAVLLPTED
ncbi:MAG: PEGA domain-containing protein, partial [Planctomycetaceae bacterium]